MQIFIKPLNILVSGMILSISVFLVNCQVELIEDGKLIQESQDSAEDFNRNTNGGFNRMERLFPFFKFGNKLPAESCATTLGYGVCLQSRDCRVKGGTLLGTCAQGFGSCCSFERSCNASKDGNEILVRENATLLITSKTVPQTPCTFTIPKGRNICQLRLDFEEFETENAQSSGNCEDDIITISGASNIKKPLTLCGNLKNQHIYLTYGKSDKISLESNIKSMAAKYSIRVSQIRCNSAIEVPEYCTQYYTDGVGEIRSLNFGQQQLNNQDYTICIKEREGAQNIQMKSCFGVNSFVISGSPSDAPISNPNDCTTDFVQIYGGNKQCGNRFTAVDSSAKPFLVQVHFDDLEAPPPLKCIPTAAPDLTTCNAQTSPGVLICLWDTVTATCCCTQINPLAPDAQNSGFCLNYVQSP